MTNYIELGNFLKSINKDVSHYLWYLKSNLPSKLYPKNSCFHILNDLCNNIGSPYRIVCLYDLGVVIRVLVSTGVGNLYHSNNEKSFDLPVELFTKKGDELKEFLKENFFIYLKSAILKFEPDFKVNEYVPTQISPGNLLNGKIVSISDSRDMNDGNPLDLENRVNYLHESINSNDVAI